MNKQSYFQKIEQRITRDKKIKKELFNNSEEISTEKSVEGKSIDEIVEPDSASKEIYKKINKFSAMRQSNRNSNILYFIRLFKAVNYASIVAFSILITYMYIKQYKILMFIIEHENASAFFFSFSQTGDIRMGILIILFIIFTLSLLALGLLKIMKARYV